VTKINPVKVIGRNCKHNEMIKFEYKDNLFKYYGLKSKKRHMCNINNRICGLNHTCNRFDDKGRLCFERKDNEN
jgi:hypothetical protein